MRDPIAFPLSRSIAIALAVTCWIVGGAAYAKATVEMDIKLTCTVDGLLLDGSTAKGDSKEDITASVKKMSWGNDKNGKPQFGSISKAEIVGQGKKVEATLVANGDSYAVIAYSDLAKQGVSTFLLTILYEVDIQTLKVRRTTSVFPTGGTIAKEVNCKKR